MLVRTAVALYLVGLAGCQSQVVDSGGSMPSAGPAETIGIEASEPQLVDGVYRVDTEEVITGTFTPDQISQLPNGETCTVELTSDRVIRGRITQAKDDILILSEAEEVLTTGHEQGVPIKARPVRQEQEPPILRNIPYVNRMFKNVGVAVESRPLGSETLSAFEIRSISVTRDTGGESGSVNQPQAGN